MVRTSQIEAMLISTSGLRFWIWEGDAAGRGQPILKRRRTVSTNMFVTGVIQRLLTKLLTIVCLPRPPPTALGLLLNQQKSVSIIYISIHGDTYGKGFVNSFAHNSRCADIVGAQLISGTFPVYSQRKAYPQLYGVTMYCSWPSPLSKKT